MYTMTQPRKFYSRINVKHAKPKWKLNGRERKKETIYFIKTGGKVIRDTYQKKKSDQR